MMQLLPLLLIPLCSLLNHLGGQSTSIPNPRIVCRVLGVTVVFGVIAFLCNIPDEKLPYATGIVLVGMGIFAIPGWASGFCCISPYNDGRQDTFLSGVVNRIMGVNMLTKLTPAQAHQWGMIYMSLRGLYLYPMFCALAILLTPWAFLIGLGSGLMGLIYGTSSLVLWAEWKMGALIGVMLCAVLYLSCC